MARFVAAAVALTAVVAGCGSGTKPHHDFASRWHVLVGRHELAAANVSFATIDRLRRSHPARTVATLPRSGTLIWAMVSPAGDGDPSRRPLPLRLDKGRPSNPFEGFQCAPAVTLSNCYAASGSIRHLYGRYGSHYVDLYVFFGTDHPSRAQLAAANAELARLKF